MGSLRHCMGGTCGKRADHVPEGQRYWVYDGAYKGRHPGAARTLTHARCSTILLPARTIDPESPEKISKESWVVEFERDKNKDAPNHKRHGIEFSEAATIFGDPLELTISDPDHSSEEHRWISMGRSGAGELLIVSYTERERSRIRIISARRANRHERRTHERKP